MNRHDRTRDMAHLFTTRADQFQNDQSVTQTTYNRTTGIAGSILTLQGTRHSTTPLIEPFVAELRTVTGTCTIGSICFPEGVGE